MCTNWLKKTSLALLFLLLLLGISSAQIPPFQGKVNANNINVRSDSTVNSQILCTLNKGEQVDIILEWYEWYKIRLPQKAPSYIKKNLVECINYKREAQNYCQNAKALKDRINIRLRPDESSPILGKINKNEIINIRGDKEEWYRIEPTANSFGWIHKKFVNKVLIINKIDNTELPKNVEQNNKKGVDKVSSLEENITVEGIIKPYGKVFKRSATHKLISSDSKIFLLKGDKQSLDALNYHKVKIIGKKASLLKQKYPIITIIKMEVIN